MYNPIYERISQSMNVMINVDEQSDTFRFAYGVLCGIYFTCVSLDMMEYWKDAKHQYRETMYGEKDNTWIYFSRIEGTT